MFFHADKDILSTDIIYHFYLGILKLPDMFENKSQKISEALGQVTLVVINHDLKN